jgi:adenylate cyclase, class 2
MNTTPIETEVKFLLSQPEQMVNRLETLRAKLVQARVFEANLRFDTVDGALMRARQVLRLRMDTRPRLTFKGPADLAAGVSSRAEIELEVSDFGTARQFLEALGYHVVVLYEKYRTTYELYETLITLDEMPYGFFAEIEGKSAETICSMAHRLELNWEARSLDSYLGIFARLQQGGLTARNLCFDEFKDLTFSPTQLGIALADAHPSAPPRS